MITRRAAIRTALPAAALCVLVTACTTEAAKGPAIPDKFPSSEHNAAMKHDAEQLRHYGNDHHQAKVTGMVERILTRDDRHVLISTRIGAEDSAMTTAAQIADTYRSYAGTTGKATTVTVYNVFNDALVTQRLNRK